LLTPETLHKMQHRTTAHDFMPGVGLGIIWMLRDIDDVRIVEHGGDTEGQSTSLFMLPEHDFAVTVLTNAGPGGARVREDLARWAVEAYLGIEVKDPEPLDLSEEELAPYVGRYATESLDLVVTVDGNRLLFTDQSPGDENAPPFRVGLVGGERYLVVDGPFKGLQGYFVRDDGEVPTALHIGRLATRVPD
jgi:Beta-lactamase